MRREALWLSDIASPDASRLGAWLRGPTPAISDAAPTSPLCRLPPTVRIALAMMFIGLRDAGMTRYKRDAAMSSQPPTNKTTRAAIHSTLDPSAGDR